jgi:hypothetical protein
MVAIRLHRYGVEALADAGTKVAVGRLGYEAALEQSGGGTVRLHRYGIEVLAKPAPKLAVSRVGHEAALAETGGGPVQLHRYGIEVLFDNSVTLAISRVGSESALLQTGAGPVQLHRLGVEVLAKTGVPDPVPLPLAADIEFWMHNWVNEVEIETSYETDVVRSPDTLAEERRSLYQRPARTLALRWTRQSKEEIYQLRLMLRRMTGENVQIPIYPDVTALNADAGPSDTTFQITTTNKRFYVGARVLFFRCNETYIQRTDVLTGIITELSAAHIKIDGLGLGIALTAGVHCVIPLIDCEIHMEPEVTWETAEVGDVELTVRERRGMNSLPPLTVGLPPGFPHRLGLPVFEIEPNWIRGVVTSYQRHGLEQRIGRRLVPLPDGDRYAQVQSWDLAPILREDWYRVASMFDSRRGRALAFWAIDREFSWTVTNTTSIFIDIAPFGRFVDFNQIWTEQNIGAAIVMKDGTIHLMQVNTVSDNGSFWRLTAVGGQSIQQPIDLSQIDFFARARISRFDSDALREVWKTNNVCEIRLRTIEVQNEKVVDFD